MSKGLTIMHSHSGLERSLRFPKHIVLVDSSYAAVFHSKGVNTAPFKYNNVEYIKVPVIDFLKAYGVFKNLDS